MSKVTKQAKPKSVTLGLGSNDPSLSHQQKCSVLVSTLGKSLHLKVNSPNSIQIISVNDFNRARWSHSYILFYSETIEFNCIAFQQQYAIAIILLSQKNLL